jgi:cation transport ATPase
MVARIELTRLTNSPAGKASRRTADSSGTARRRTHSGPLLDVADRSNQAFVQMHPFVRNVVIGLVGLLIAAGLTAMAVLGENTTLSVAAMLASALIAVAIGVFLFVQGWIWSQRAYRSRSTGMSVAIALGGGLMIMLAAVALAGAVILVVLFYL